ncbi:hypothetical protein DIPPA_13289 [Diplonema papillatum]|nr:hypothetical protein DIPPA_13289 [Diplonema papillatum]
MQPNAYELLGLHQNATHEAVLQTREQLREQWHPTKHQGELRRIAMIAWRKLVLALTDVGIPDARLQYDRREEGSQGSISFTIEELCLHPLKAAEESEGMTRRVALLGGRRCFDVVVRLEESLEVAFTIRQVPDGVQRRMRLPLAAGKQPVLELAMREMCRNGTGDVSITHISATTCSEDGVHVRLQMTPSIFTRVGTDLHGDLDYNGFTGRLIGVYFDHPLGDRYAFLFPGGNRLCVLESMGCHQGKLAGTMYLKVRSSSLLKPWFPPEANWRGRNAPECSVCDKSFGVLRRPHHCRGCGTSACDTCAKEVTGSLREICRRGNPAFNFPGHWLEKPERLCGECMEVVKLNIHPEKEYYVKYEDVEKQQRVPIV